ncbi:MAG: Gfo/Idh/MocA family protein [Alphaproteobacteria bacterium]
MASQKLRCAVIGVGHFGRYHAQKYAAHPGVDLVGVFDRDAARARSVASEVGTTIIETLDDLAGRVDAVSVAVTTAQHFAVARPLLSAGIHALIEKPLATTLAEADGLIAAAREGGAVLQVGHLERFSPAYDAIAHAVRKPLFIESYRISPFQPRVTDVNVVLDLMIHDIDMILALVNAEVLSVDAVGAPVVGPREDIANTRVRFANGCVASITASRVSLKTERIMRIFQPDHYLVVDFQNGTTRAVERGAGEMFPGVPNIRETKNNFGKADSLAREIDAFVAAARDGSVPLVDGAAGRRALAVALDISAGLTAHWAFVQQAAGLDGAAAP